jgi:Zn ribbon nucleic-acid-binding protein
MSSEVYLPECVVCGRIKLNGYWYQPFQTPPHFPNYRGALCPDCQAKKQAKKEQLTTSTEKLNCILSPLKKEV